MQCFRKVSRFFTGKRFKDSSWSWIVCVSAAVCNSVYLGMVLSFGVLFPVLMEYFDETRERTAFVGSIGLGMIWFASPLAGYLCDRFGCRITCFLGGTLYIAGLVSTSLVHSFTVMYFTYSALYGLGACLIFNPCIRYLLSLIGTFPKRVLLLYRSSTVKIVESISAQKASQLFIVIGLLSSFSRLLTGRLYNYKRVNPVYIFQLCMVIVGLATFMLSLTTEYGNVIAFSVIYGLSDRWC
ncbi:monocarboxylate transporter 10-like [Orbicella faveolata]|uniref:monocarboxylate transporter 10-like n=1 Tax=Orbicella faveolata TaxID=48498 RepID=UPI0009E25B3D|nr:monocarboxylate transporter 10-like [Orbicella faveolata]